MSRFSEREGLRPSKGLQLKSMDSDLRAGLWNVVSPAFFVYNRDYGRPQPPGYWPWERELGVRLWRDFFKYPVDTMPANWKTIAAQIRDWFFKATWYDVYDIVEFLGAHAVEAGFNSENSMHFHEACNRMLERESSGYRFLQGQLQAITDQLEMATVDQAMTIGDRAVREHLRGALDLLSDRKAPDYRGSVREALNAIEGLCRSMLGEQISLDELLRQLGQEPGPHNALRQALAQMFGFSSGEHSAGLDLVERADIGFDEAKFMLVASAALVYYLKVKEPLLKATSRQNQAAVGSSLTQPPPARESRRIRG